MCGVAAFRAVDDGHARLYFIVRREVAVGGRGKVPSELVEIYTIGVVQETARRATQFAEFSGEPRLVPSTIIEPERVDAHMHGVA